MNSKKLMCRSKDQQNQKLVCALKKLHFDKIDPHPTPACPSKKKIPTLAPKKKEEINNRNKKQAINTDKF